MRINTKAFKVNESVYLLCVRTHKIIKAKLVNKSDSEIIVEKEDGEQLIFPRGVSGYLPFSTIESAKKFSETIKSWGEKC
jgi:hypothetical protein